MRKTISATNAEIVFLFINLRKYLSPHLVMSKIHYVHIYQVHLVCVMEGQPNFRIVLLFLHLKQPSIFLVFLNQSLRYRLLLIRQLDLYLVLLVQYAPQQEIGRASCRERVYVTVVAVWWKGANCTTTQSRW